LAPDENLQATVPFQYGLVAFYDLYWGRHWTNSIGYSQTMQLNTAGQTGSAMYRLHYAIVNTTYHIKTGRFVVALEYQFGKRITKNGNFASNNRIMFTARAFFGKKSLF
jgi:hypothetical protein